MEETLVLLHSPDGRSFTIQGWEHALPPIPQHGSKYARTLTQSEFAALIHTFRDTNFSGAFLARVFELYVVAKRAQTYQDLLKNRHTTQRGGSMTDIREQNPGSLDAPHVCGACYEPV